MAQRRLACRNVLLQEFLDDDFHRLNSLMGITKESPTSSREAANSTFRYACGRRATLVERRLIPYSLSPMALEGPLCPRVFSKVKALPVLSAPHAARTPASGRFCCTTSSVIISLN